MEETLDYDLKEPVSDLQVDMVQFATADDGTPLHWAIKEPDPAKFPPPWFCVLGIHGGGFRDGAPNTPYGKIAEDLAAEGFITFHPEYRLAPEGSIEGQTSDGRYPNQTNDIVLAYKAAKKDPRVKGKSKPQTVGASAGGYFVNWLAAHGMASGVSLSGASQMDDADSRASHPGFASLCDNYAPNQLTEASPAEYVTEESRPVFLTTFTIDTMPPRQAGLMAAKLANYGIGNIVITLPGQGHAWPAWDKVKAQAIPFLHKYKKES